MNRETEKNAGGNKILKPNIRCWHLKQLLLEQENKNKNKMRFDILFPPSNNISQLMAVE